jgi:hypothetical protein
MCSPGGGASDLVKQQKQQQQAIENATKQINQSFAGYTPDWYQQQTSKFESAQMPQLQEQLGQTQKQLGFQLAGQGLGDSSAAKQLGESLSTEYGKQQQNVAQQALAQTQGLQRNIEQARSNLIGEASASQSPSTIAQQSLNVASEYAAPSAMQPLGQMFQNWSNMYLGKQLGQLYNPSTTQTITPYTSSAGGYGGRDFSSISTGM